MPSPLCARATEVRSLANSYMIVMFVTSIFDSTLVIILLALRILNSVRLYLFIKAGVFIYRDKFRHKDVIVHRSYAHNLSSCEIKA